MMCSSSARCTFAPIRLAPTRSARSSPSRSAAAEGRNARDTCDSQCLGLTSIVLMTRYTVIAIKRDPACNPTQSWYSQELAACLHPACPNWDMAGCLHNSVTKLPGVQSDEARIVTRDILPLTYTYLIEKYRLICYRLA